VVVRFDYPSLGRRLRVWMLVERREVKVCRLDPGGGDDLVVTVADPLTFARWHLGLVDWGRRCAPGRSGSRGRPA
jgi:hypothetical protein